MALPMNTMPTFNTVVPSTGKRVRYRPFVVKDEKALMIAQQSEDPIVMVDTLKAVIKSCILDEIDVDSLATFDLEYLFIQLRGKSVGETIELLFSCDEDHGELNDKAKQKVTIDLSTIKVEKSPDHSNKIILFGDVGVVLKYPTLESTKKLESMSADNLDNVFDVIADSIDFIFQGEDVFYAKEQKKEELLQFINNLSSEQFIKLQKFFDTMPKVRTEVDYKCPICGKEHHRVLEGIQSFF